MNPGQGLPSSARFCAIALFALAQIVPHAHAAETPWPAAVPGWKTPVAGEHPRLFFRKSELPELRQRAQTPEGKAIIERCKFLLGIEGNPEVPYTLWHGAAAGFLYQATGDRKYAELARQHVDKALDGAFDSDKRYSFRRPSEPLRAGPSLASIALAYDLAYDGWDEAYRRKICEALMNYDEPTGKGGPRIGLERLSLNPLNPNPISNHLGLQVGGAGLTILAIKGDPGADDAKLEKFQAGVDKYARKILTEDFGEGGYFGEQAGPGVIASTWTFIPWLQAQRVCAGRDWLTPEHPAAEWISLRFVMQTLPSDKGPVYTNPSPQGGYGTEFLIQDGGHHAAYFCQGFGAIRRERRPAMRWVYEQFVEPTERKLYPAQFKAGERSFDAFRYPHRCMFSFVNWPFAEQAENPEKALPKVAEDRRMGHYVFRNRWQDADDTIVAVLFGSRLGDRVSRCMVWGLGQRMVFGDIAPSVEGSAKINKAKIDSFQPADDGSGVVSAGGNAVGVDYSKASGADALVVMIGPGATGQISGADAKKSRVMSVTAGTNQFSILTLSSTGAHPEPKAEGDKVTVGGQTISFDGTKIIFGKMSGPLRIRQ